jgi:hypothetical protein
MHKVFTRTNKGDSARQKHYKMTRDKKKRGKKARGGARNETSISYE